jgi:hypothetical protein
MAKRDSEGSKGDDIKQRSIPSEDTSWRSKGGYASNKYVIGSSGGYPESDDSEGTSKPYSPADPNCGPYSGTAGKYSPDDPNCGPSTSDTFKGYSPADPNRS